MVPDKSRPVHATGQRQLGARDWVTILSVVAAVLTVVAATIGLVRETRGPDGVANPPPSIVGSPPTAEPPPTTEPEPSPPVQTPTATRVQSVRRQGRVNVADNQIDLNSPSSDPTWGTDEIPSYPLQSDILSYSWGTIHIQADYLPMPRASKVDYEACSTATGYRQGLAQNIEPDDLEEADTCVHLESGRFAKVRLLDITDDTAVMDITVWEKD